MSLEAAFPGMKFEQLVGLYPLPSGNWLAVEQKGVVTLIDVTDSRRRVFLDIEDRVHCEAVETGLLGLAVAEDSTDSGTLYVPYTANKPLRSKLSRFSSNGEAAVAESETVLLEIQQPHAIHNAGQLVFGPDGYLYVCVGDGGGFSDPFGNGQNLTTLLGSVLRLDVSGSAGYRVPADNPLLGDPGARDEIWAYGFRNPWRFSFDPDTSELWLSDAGENRREEVNVAKRGGNYGWSILEGTTCFREDDCSRAGLRPPIIEYAHVDGDCAIAGGFVYRGGQMPALNGAYIFGDFCSGRIWALDSASEAEAEVHQIGAAGFSISSFARGNSGEIYVLEYSKDGGEIYKVTLR